MARFTPQEIDSQDLIDYIEDNGAVTTKMIKESFGTDSRHVRQACGRLLIRDDLNLIAMGGKRGTVWWLFWERGRKGKPSPEKMHNVAEAERRLRLGLDGDKPAPPPEPEDNWWE